MHHNNPEMVKYFLAMCLFSLGLACGGGGGIDGTSAYNGGGIDGTSGQNVEISVLSVEGSDPLIAEPSVLSQSSFTAEESSRMHTVPKFVYAMALATATNVLVQSHLTALDESDRVIETLGESFVVPETVSISNNRDDVAMFNLSDLTVGDYVKVEGRMIDSNFVIDQISLEIPESDFVISGNITGLVWPYFRLWNIELDAGSALFYDESNQVISREEFFQRLDLGGTGVTIRGYLP
jgi:hypothetical protein